MQITLVDLLDNEYHSKPYNAHDVNVVDLFCFLRTYCSQQIEVHVSGVWALSSAQKYEMILLDYVTSTASLRHCDSTPKFCSCASGLRVGADLAIIWVQERTDD